MTLSVSNSFKLLFFLIVYVTIIHQVASQDEVVSSNDDDSDEEDSYVDDYSDEKVSQNEDYSNQEVSSNDGNENEENSYDERSGEVEPLRPPQCGQKIIFQLQTRRVLGGSPAEVGAWPWMARLGSYETDEPNEEFFMCGASLISSQHVLTAAHCVDEEENRLFVRLGEYDFSSDDDGANPLDVLVEEVIIHSDYDSDTFENDIAILKLTEEVEFTDYIHPICLPVEDDIKNRNFVNNYPFVAGWGKISFGGPSSKVLREAQLPVVDEETCEYAYRDLNAVVDNRVICAGYAEGGTDTCQGDSGGPMMLPQNDNYYLIGIVSSGSGCGLPGIPGLYTRVTSFLDFILSNMN